MRLQLAPLPHHFAVLDSEGIDTFGIRNLLKKAGGTLSASKKWIFPLHAQSLDLLRRTLRERDYELTYDGELIRALNRSYTGEIVHHLVPYPHQEKGTRWLMGERGAILTDEMGLGKTKQAIDAAGNLHPAGVVVLCPVSLLDNWKREILTNWPDSHVYLVSGDPAQRMTEIEAFISSQTKPLGYLPWLVVNYDKVRYKQGAQMSREAAAVMKAVTPNTILICDEAHRLKNHKAQCSAAVRMMTPDRIWLLTGTPVANRPEDVWHLCRLVRPGLLGWYFSHFDQAHIIRDRFGGVGAYKELPLIRDYFGSVSFGRKKEGLLHLPSKIFMERVVDLSPEEARAYKQMEKNMLAWLQTEANFAEPIFASEFSTRFIRLRQLADGFGQNSAGEGAVWVPRPSKVKECIQVWEDAGYPRLVIWCVFRELMKRVTSEFEKIGASVLQIHGSVSPHDRQARVDEWARVPSAVLINQINAAGVGLNLQAGSFQIFLDPPQTPMERLQAIDRQHRIGQEYHVTVVDIIAKKTVDAMIYRRLALKMVEADQVTAGSFQRELIHDFMDEHGLGVAV